VRSPTPGHGRCRLYCHGEARFYPAGIKDPTHIFVADQSVELLLPCMLVNTAAMGIMSAYRYSAERFIEMEGLTFGYGEAELVPCVIAGLYAGETVSRSKNLRVYQNGDRLRRAQDITGS